MNRPSGDQNGVWAPSVPGSARYCKESSGRIQSENLPPASAEMARERPSGEIAKLSIDEFSGGGIVYRKTGLSGVDSRKWITAIRSAASMATAASPGQSQRRLWGA